jgi:glycine oxidase
MEAFEQLATGRRVVVVGGGLAGLFVAARHIQAGASVLLIDGKEANSASRIAAGLFNPITGKRWALAWEYRKLQASLLGFFDDALFQGLRKWLHLMPIYRSFPSVYDLNEWSGRSTQPLYEPYCEVELGSYMPDRLVNPNGGLVVHQGGWLEVDAFLQELNRVLIRTGRFTTVNKRISYDIIDPKAGKLRMGRAEEQFHAIVFCEGASYRANPHWVFRSLPLLKGQILRVRMPNLGLDRILNGPPYVIPCGNDEYLVGATYEVEYRDVYPSDYGREDLLKQLKALLPNEEPEVLTHEAALRPTGPLQLRPCIGPHPELSRVWFMNAMGTKGVLNAPYFSQELTKWMWDPDYKPEREVDIRRLVL